MIRYDALKLIQDTAVKADGNRVITVKGEPPHVYYLLQQDGSLKKCFAERQQMNHSALDFDSLSERIQRSMTGTDVTPSVWYDITGVTAVISNDYRDYSRLNLTVSKQMALMMEWDKNGDKNFYEHGPLYRLLRTLLRDSMSNNTDLLNLIGKINITKGADVTSAQARGNVSLHKKMVSEATGIDKLPEFVTFDVPFFAESICEVTVDIRVAFDIDAEKEKFQLYVYPGEINNAIITAEQYLQKTIQKSLDNYVPPVTDEESTVTGRLVPVYRGKW